MLFQINCLDNTSTLIHYPGPDPSAVPTTESGLKLSPLHLANALAACVLSARLGSEHRQWAAQQLVKTLSAQV